MDDPKQSLEEWVGKLRAGELTEWPVQFEFVHVLRRVVVHHPSLITPELSAEVRPRMDSGGLDWFCLLSCLHVSLPRNLAAASPSHSCALFLVPLPRKCRRPLPSALRSNHHVQTTVHPFVSPARRFGRVHQSSLDSFAPPTRMCERTTPSTAFRVCLRTTGCCSSERLWRFTALSARAQRPGLRVGAPRLLWALRRRRRRCFAPRRPPHGCQQEAQAPGPQGRCRGGLDGAWSSPGPCTVRRGDTVECCLVALAPRRFFG